MIKGSEISKYSLLTYSDSNSIFEYEINGALTLENKIRSYLINVVNLDKVVKLSESYNLRVRTN